MSLPDGASMKRITTAVVREYALLPVTAGRAVALATVPTMMFLSSPLGRAMADDYFDPAALEFADHSSKPPICTIAKPGGQQPGTYPVTVVVNDRELVRLISRLLTMAAAAPGADARSAGGVWRQRQRVSPPFKRCMKAKLTGSRSLFRRQQSVQLR